MTPSDLVALVARLRDARDDYSHDLGLSHLFGDAKAAIEQLQAEVESWKMKFEQSNGDRIRILNEVGEEKVRRQWTTVENERDALRAECERMQAALTRFQYPPEHRVSVAEAERDALQIKLKNYEPINTYDGRDIDSWRTEEDSLRAELAACKQDAERFVWWFTVENDVRTRKLTQQQIDRAVDGEILSLADWRAAIDAARAQAGGK